MKPFCEQLVEVRKSRGMTQDQLASELNITRQGVSRWENGKTLPDIETLKRLSQVLSYDFMMDETACPTQHSSPLFEPLGDSAEDLKTVLDNTLSSFLRKHPNLLRCALCLSVGLIAGCLIGVYLLPHPAQVKAASALVNQTPVQIDYQPDVLGEAHLVISATENPVKAVRTADDSAAWFYTVAIKNTGELSFTTNQLEQYCITDDGTSSAIPSCSAADLGWGDGVILPGCEQSFSGGFPVQPLKGVHIIISGTDANGKALSFEGEVVLAKEIAE